jgi:hypothetical protein
MPDIDKLDRRTLITAWLCGILAPYHFGQFPAETDAAAAQRWRGCAHSARLLADALIREIDEAPFPAGAPVTNPRWQDPPF